MRTDPALLDQIRRTNQERRLLTPGTRVLVAVSGGADSLALLHALHSMRAELGIDLATAHLHHGMRGAAADSDAAFVRDFARSLELPVEVERRDIPRLARRTGLSLEEAGREARYRFFARAARRTSSDHIATAHTADDRAENVLLHLFRGTGLDGLAGIPARRPLRPEGSGPFVVRPLIDVTRDQIMAYCAAHGLEPRHDTTNDSPAFLRNRVRRELIPLLVAEYSPALRRHLVRLAGLAEEETAFLDVMAVELLRAAMESLNASSEPGSAAWPCSLSGHEEELPAPREAEQPPWITRLTDPMDEVREPLRPLHGTIRLDWALMAKASVPLIRRALRHAIMLAEPGPAPEMATVERLLSLAEGERPGFLLPGGRTAAHCSGEVLILEPVDPVPGFLLSEPVGLVVPGITRLSWSYGPIAAWSALEPCDVAADGSVLLAMLPRDPREALLDSDQLRGSLRVRPPQPGDRIQPLGMIGRRKLQDLFTDHKVPRMARRRVPVVCDEEKIVWVAGHTISERVKITTATRRAIRLRWEGEGSGPAASPQQS